MNLSVKLFIQNWIVVINQRFKKTLFYSTCAPSPGDRRDRKSELVLSSTYQIFEWDRNNSDRNFYNVVRYVHITLGLPVTWLNTIWLNFFVESFGLKILGQVTTKLSQLHSNSRNKYVNSGKYHNVGHMQCMHARPHRRKDQLPLRSLRDRGPQLRSKE